jgi:DNA modification methylase
VDPYFQNHLVTIYHGDSREIIPTISGVTAVVTDPPYHLTQISRGGSCRSNDPETPFGRHKIGEKGFMGKTWDGGGISFDPEFWRLALNCALPGAYLISFGGTRTYHRIACAIEDGGWNIFQQLQWIYGSGFPKSRAIGKAIDEEAGAEREVVGIKQGHENFAGRLGGYRGSKHGWDRPWMHDDQKSVNYHNKTAPATEAAKLWEGYGTDLKPAHEPVCLARKPLDGTYAQNALKHGCGGLAIDACRVKPQETDDYGRSAANSNGTINAHSGFEGKSFAIKERDGEYASNLGRWPANVITDGSEEVLRGFPDNAGAAAPIKGTEPTEPGKDAYGFRRVPNIFHGDTGSAARFFYCAKARGEEREDNTHATVKPLALMEYLCRLIKQPARNLVLDPFAGSGTTLLACELLGIQSIGIEMDEGHCEIIAKRFSKPAEPYLL